MPAQNTSAFTPSELSTLDAMISHIQQSGVGPDEPVPLTTAIIAVVAQAAVATVAVLCLKAPEDTQKFAQIKNIADSLKSSTTLNNLLELRRRAVSATGKTVTDARP